MLEEALQQSPKWVHGLIRDILESLVFPVHVEIGDDAEAYHFDLARFRHVLKIVPYKTPEETVCSYIEILERAWGCEYVHPSIAFFAFDEETPPALIQKVRLELMMASSWILSRLSQERFPDILKVHRAETLSEYQDMIRNWERLISVQDDRVLKELSTMMSYLFAWLRKYAEDIRVSIPDTVLAVSKSKERIDQVKLISRRAQLFLNFPGPWDIQGFLQLTNQLLEASGKKHRVRLAETPVGIEPLKIVLG